MARSSGLLLGFLAGVLVLLVLGGPSAMEHGTGVDGVGDEVNGDTDPRSQRIAELIDRYDCWTGAAPDERQGRLPGHVVHTPPGSERAEVGGGVMVGRALGHVFEGHHPAMQVHAFCP